MESAVLKARARELIAGNIPKIFILSIIYLLLITIINEVAFRLPGTVDFQNFYDRLFAGESINPTLIYRQFKPFGVILALILHIFKPIFNFGYISCCIKLSRNQNTEYKDILNGFYYVFRILSVFIITTVLTLLWGLLFIIPGIVAAYRYRLVYYILLDDPNKGVFQCIEESRLLMNGGKLDLLVIDLSFAGWYILNFAVVFLLPLPFAMQILMIWVFPYRGLTNACFYEYRRNSLAV